MIRHSKRGKALIDSTMPHRGRLNRPPLEVYSGYTSGNA